MKLLLFVVGFAVAVSAYSPIDTDYHNTYGVPEAARIKQAEESTDFDGSRITGGSSARLGQFPYLGGLLVTLTDGRQSACGSSLISATRAVTAAHCWVTRNARARQVTVVLGTITLFSGGVRVNSNNVRVHGSYNMNTLANDIAIIVLNSVSLNNNIRPIGIASGSNQYVGTWATASGFGRTSDSSSVSSNLNHVNLQVITNDVCRRTYGSTVIASTICTATPNGRSICQGDSGGPLAVGNTLIGVTSFSHRQGCTRGHPAGFARVTSFNSWIRSNM
ncbi:trypsin alpha-3-like [Danaus plexippus]|uniref:trypsin alpha-3-like n=1 Tax=Danaus plexippus TaxID=13037 RepID=UPI002AB2B395|nr:trypsin alpha-3-like [Danaus plexippus]